MTTNGTMLIGCRYVGGWPMIVTKDARMKRAILHTGDTYYRVKVWDYDERGGFWSPVTPNTRPICEAFPGEGEWEEIPVDNDSYLKRCWKWMKKQING